MVDTTAAAQPAPPPHHPKHHWMVPRSWSEWVGSIILLGVVAICAFGAGLAIKTYDFNRAAQEIDRINKDNQNLRAELQRETKEKKDLKDRLKATDSRLKDAFNAYRTIVLDDNDMASVSTGHFAVGLVGPPTNERVTINVDGTQHTVAAGDTIPVGACRVEVKKFDPFKMQVTLLTSCTPMKP